MTRAAAKNAIADGKKVRHSLFVGNEFVTKSKRKGWLEDEDGFTFNEEEFWRHRSGAQWETGWSIVP